MVWFNTLFKQTFWQILAKVITSLSTLAILSAITNRYSAEQTGIYTLAITYLSFFYIATDFGVNAHLLPELMTGKIQHSFPRLLGFRIILGMILMLIALALLPIMPFTTIEFSWAVIFGVATILGYSLFLTFAALYQSKLRYDLIAYGMLFSTPISVGFIYLISYFNYPLAFAFLGHVLGWILFCLLSFYFSHKLAAPIKPIFDFAFYKEILLSVWPISLTLLMNTLYFRIDAFILTSVTSFSEVGIYNLAYQLFQSALVLPTFITNSFYPLLIKNLQKDKTHFLKDFFSISGLMLLLSLLGIITTWILAPNVISWFGGDKFTGSITSLRILSLGFPAFFLSSILMWTLISLKKYKSVLLIYLVGLTANFVLNLIYAPHYSYIASSWITGISEYLILFLQLCILVPLLKKVNQ